MPSPKQSSRSSPSPQRPSRSSPSPQHSSRSSPSPKSLAGSSPSPQYSGGSSGYEGEESGNLSSHEALEPQIAEMAATGTATAARFQKAKPQKKKQPQKRLPEPIKLGATEGEVVTEAGSALIGSSATPQSATDLVKRMEQDGGDVAESAVGNDDKQDKDSGVKAIRSSLRRSGQLHREVARMSNSAIPHAKDLAELWVEQDRELRILRPENKDLTEAVDKLEGLYSSARETNVDNKNLIDEFSKEFQDLYQANEVCNSENERLRDAVHQGELKLHECFEEAKKSAQECAEMTETVEGLKKKLTEPNEKDKRITTLQADLKGYLILQAKAGALEAVNKQLDADRIATREQLANLFEIQRGLEEQLREFEGEREARKKAEEKGIRESLQRSRSTAANSLNGDDLEKLGESESRGADGDTLDSGKRFSTQSRKRPMSEKRLPQKPLPKQPRFTYPQEGTEIETASCQNLSGDVPSSVLEVNSVPEAEPSTAEVSVKRSSADSTGSGATPEVEPPAAEAPSKKSSLDLTGASTTTEIEQVQYPENIDSPLGQSLFKSIRDGKAVEYTPVEEKSSSTDNIDASRNSEDWRPLPALLLLVQQLQTNAWARVLKGLEIVKRALPAREGKARCSGPESNPRLNTADQRDTSFTDAGWWFILLGLVLMWYLDFFAGGNDQQLWMNANDLTRQRVIELRDERWMYPLWVLRCAFSLESMLSVDRVLLA